MTAKQKRTVIKIGDVFSVLLGEGHKKYFQYVANDLTQLNSDVVRAFKKEYPVDAMPDVDEIVRDDVDFYVHAVISLGVKMGLWDKVGNAPVVGDIDVLFRDTNDYGNREIVSNNWYVWRINKPFQKIGRLEGDFRNAHVGIVVSPPRIVDRMRKGQFDLAYPG